MASESGCYNGYIENGFVETSYCKVYSSDSRVYCPYYCNDGYKKTTSSVYCAGNDKWLSTTDPYTENVCVKNGDSISGCHNSMFFDNGYVVSCHNSGYKVDCPYHCYNGYIKTSSTVYCGGNDRWMPTGSKPFENVLPCVTNGITTPTTTTKRSIYTTSRQPRTTMPGYYEDPSLKMNVSPVVFVGAVVGGIAILVLLVFAIFFRAHRKSSRESRARSACMVSGDHSPTQYQNDRNDFINYYNSDQHDDSDFRNIARRILERASNDSSTDTPQQNGFEPPPYEAISPTNYGGSPDRSGNLNEEPSRHNPPSPPYTAVNIPIPGDTQTLPFQPDESQQSPQYDQNAVTFNSSANSEVDEIDKPPPYEALNFRETNENVLCVQHKNLPTGSDSTDPPPPYIAYKGSD